jgi:hypothetical protein
MSSTNKILAASPRIQFRDPAAARAGGYVLTAAQAA